MFFPVQIESETSQESDCGLVMKCGQGSGGGAGGGRASTSLVKSEGKGAHLHHLTRPTHLESRVICSAQNYSQHTLQVTLRHHFYLFHSDDLSSVFFKLNFSVRIV